RCVLATTLLPARHCRRPLGVLGLPSAAYRVCAPVLAVADRGRWAVPRLAKARGPPSWSQDPDSTPAARQRVQMRAESPKPEGQYGQTIQPGWRCGKRPASDPFDWMFVDTEPQGAPGPRRAVRLQTS